jgi:hypothetical protein
LQSGFGSAANSQQMCGILIWLLAAASTIQRGQAPYVIVQPQLNLEISSSDAASLTSTLDLHFVLFFKTDIASSPFSEILASLDILHDSLCHLP